MSSLEGQHLNSKSNRRGSLVRPIEIDLSSRSNSRSRSAEKEDSLSTMKTSKPSLPKGDLNLRGANKDTKKILAKGQGVFRQKYISKAITRHDKEEDCIFLGSCFVVDHPVVDLNTGMLDKRIFDEKFDSDSITTTPSYSLSQKSPSPSLKRKYTRSNTFKGVKPIVLFDQFEDSQKIINLNEDDEVFEVAACRSRPKQDAPLNKNSNKKGFKKNRDIIQIDENSEDDEDKKIVIGDCEEVDIDKEQPSQTILVDPRSQAKIHSNGSMKKQIFLVLDCD